MARKTTKRSSTVDLSTSASKKKSVPNTPARVIVSALSKFGDKYKDVWADTEKLIRISTGFLTLDQILGGGVIEGSIVEGFGKEHSGKSTLAWHMVPRFTGEDQIALLADYEQCADPVYIKAVSGIEVVRMGKPAEEWFKKHSKKKHHPPVILWYQPMYLEQGCDLALDLIDKLDGRVRLLIHDSLAAMTPKEIVEGDMEDQHIGAQARALTKFYNKSLGLLRKKKCTLWVVNQVRTRIGIGFGQITGEESAGGKATKFYAMQRAKFGSGETHPWKTYLGNSSHCAYIQTVKNKAAEERRGTTRLIHWPGRGFSPEIELLELMFDHNVFGKEGTTFTFREAGPYTKKQLLEMLVIHEQRSEVIALFHEALKTKLEETGAMCLLKDHISKHGEVKISGGPMSMED